MTLNEFASVYQGAICVVSGYNGKVLCQTYNPEKHQSIGEREIHAVYPAVRVDKRFANFGQAIVKAYVDGSPEYDKEHNGR